MPSLPFDLPDQQLLAGEIVAFTGKLASLRRKDAVALVGRLGGIATDDLSARTTMLVVGAGAVGPSRSPAADDKRVRRAEQLNAEAAARIRIVSEDQFCGMVGVPSSAALKRQFYGLREILQMYPLLREEHVRDLQKVNLVTPAAHTGTEPFFTFSDLLVFRQIGGELERGVSFKAVLRSLLASRQGQLAFDFRRETQPAKILALRNRTEPLRKLPTAPAGHVAAVNNLSGDALSLGEQYFMAGSVLDDGEAQHQEKAAALYRRALEADPYLVPALINLANIHYALDELAEAEALYERAIGLEADYFEAFFNLGNVHHDLGRYDDAQRCYRQAILLNPRFADAHLYLAVALEKSNDSEQAKVHWRAYQELAPCGEWVELAREFSE